jgi:hypothetical protein
MTWKERESRVENRRVAPGVQAGTHPRTGNQESLAITLQWSTPTSA